MWYAAINQKGAGGAVVVLDKSHAAKIFRGACPAGRHTRNGTGAGTSEILRLTLPCKEFDRRKAGISDVNEK